MGFLNLKFGFDSQRGYALAGYKALQMNGLQCFCFCAVSTMQQHFISMPFEDGIKQHTKGGFAFVFALLANYLQRSF